MTSLQIYLIIVSEVEMDPVTILKLMEVLLGTVFLFIGYVFSALGPEAPFLSWFCYLIGGGAVVVGVLGLVGVIA